MAKCKRATLSGNLNRVLCYYLSRRWNIALRMKSGRRAGGEDSRIYTLCRLSSFLAAACQAHWRVKRRSRVKKWRTVPGRRDTLSYGLLFLRRPHKPVGKGLNEPGPRDFALGF